MLHCRGAVARWDTGKFPGGPLSSLEDSQKIFGLAENFQQNLITTADFCISKNVFSRWNYSLETADIVNISEYLN